MMMFIWRQYTSHQIFQFVLTLLSLCCKNNHLVNTQIAQYLHKKKAEQMLKHFKPTRENICEFLEQQIDLYNIQDQTIKFIDSDLSDQDLNYIFRHFHLRKMFLINFFKTLGFDFSLDYDSQRDDNHVDLRKVNLRKRTVSRDQSNPANLFHVNHLTFMSSLMKEMQIEIVHLKDMPLRFVDLKISFNDANGKKIGSKTLEFDLTYPSDALRNISVEIQRIYQTHKTYQNVLDRISGINIGY
jgi:hypothetical protein